jgi:hypothetical protein
MMIVRGMIDSGSIRGILGADPMPWTRGISAIRALHHDLICRREDESAKAAGRTKRVVERDESKISQSRNRHPETSWWKSLPRRGR